MNAAKPAATLVETRIAEIGTALAQAFGDVLNELPGGPHRPQALARSLGLNTVLTSRLLKAAQQPDPLAVAHTIPGPEPLRRVLRAAERKRVAAERIQAARDAVDRFEHLIDIEAGDRSALDALISGWLPDAREKVELLAKQSVFRGISQLLGMMCDAQHVCLILHPGGPARDRADEVWLTVTRGLRRVRPGLIVTYDTLHSAPPVLTLAGRPIDDPTGVLLERFCSRPLPNLAVSQVGAVAKFMLCGDEVGAQSGVDLAQAVYLPARKELRGEPGAPPSQTSVAAGIAVPSKSLIFDVLLHPDVYPGQAPSLELFRMAGVFDRATRDDNDRLEVIESIQPLGQGVSKFRVTETPDYPQMLRHVCEERGWDGEVLRGYRCRIEYPVYSSEVVFLFDLPGPTP